MDRISFFKSVEGIQYPEVLVNFFDHFIALKQIVNDSAKVSVNNVDQNTIEVGLTFHSKMKRNEALSTITPQQIYIYGRPIKVNVDILTGKEIKIILQ